MKNIEKLALIMAILYLAAALADRFGRFLTINLTAHGWTTTEVSAISIPMAVIVIAVHIAIAIWLYRESRKEGRARWVWGLFGLAFGVSGVILFYAARIYEILKAQIGSEHS